MERCVTPVVSEVLQRLVETQAFKPALRHAFTLQGGSASNDRLELLLQDARQQPHRITLALVDVAGFEHVGRGQRFDFPAAAEARDANATQAQIEAAAILDAAMPDAAFAACGSKEVSEQPGPMVPLASAGAQILVLVAAVIYGLRVLRQP